MTGPRFLALITCTLAVGALGARSVAAQQPGGKQVINPPNARPGGVLSTAVRVGNVIYLSGALGTRPGGVWQSLHTATARWLDFNQPLNCSCIT